MNGQAKWASKVTVVVHRVPETEDYEGGFEAVTMTGVPGTVTVTATDRDDKEEAFRSLLEDLRTFGFSGRVAVEDATILGRPERYEVEV